MEENSAETVDKCNPTDQADDAKEEKEVHKIIEEKEQIDEKHSTSHQNGSVRLRKTKRSTNKQENTTKKSQEIKKILAAKASGKSKAVSGVNFTAKIKGFLTGNAVWMVSFLIVVILTISTRFYNLSDPAHIW